MTYNPAAYSGRKMIDVQEKIDVSGETRWLGRVILDDQAKPTDIMILFHDNGYIGLPLLCNHAGAPLTEGTMTSQGTLICPRHGHEYELRGNNGIGFEVLRDGDEFFLEQRNKPDTENIDELKDKILSLEMELEAQRAANSALENQVIAGMESMDHMFSEMEAKKTEWKEKSLRLETLNDLVTRVTDSINEVMVIAGSNGKIKRVNQQTLDVFKCDQVEFIDRSVDSLLSSSDLSDLGARYKGQISDQLPLLYQLCFIEAPFEAEVSLRIDLAQSNIDRTSQSYLLRGTRLYDRYGKEEGAIFVASDISRVKERELRLRQNEIEKTLQLFEGTLNNVGQAIAVFDDECNLLVSNDEFGNITGCPKEWLLPGVAYSKFLFLEDDNVRLCSLSQLDREGERLKKTGQRWESFYKDGRVIDCSTNVMPNGGFVLVARDVTEQREEAEIIRRLSYAVEQSPVEVIITDVNGNIEYVNQKFVDNTGYDKEYAVGRKTSMVRSGQTPNQYYEHLWKTLKEGKNWSGEVLNKRKDGSVFWQQLSVAPMYDPNGNVKNYLATKENIDERKQAEAELAQHRDHLQELVEERSRELITARDEAEQANRAKTEFLSSMSHELRTPLNGILGFAQLLEMNRQEALSETQNDYVQHILKAGQHLLGLISEILDLAKIEAGKMALNLEQINISQMMLESIALISNMAQDKELTINDMVSSGDFHVFGDGIRVKQTIVNVLSNAVKYNRDGGEVMVTAQINDDGMLALSITDTGYGIPSEKMDDLFTPFNRLGAEGQNIEGSGIGLTITRKLMHMMGGEITANSEEGVGSTFTLLMPTSQPTMTPVNSNNIEGAIVLSLADGDDEAFTDSDKIEDYSSKTLLYVEDNSSNQFLVERALTNMSGLKLKCVNNAKTGLELAKRDKPNLILMDINLPGMTGFEAMNVIKNDDDLCAIPVVALSAKALQSDIEKGLNAGFRAYLTKPLNIPNLLETIDRILEEHII